MIKLCSLAAAAFTCIASPGWGDSAQQARFDEARFDEARFDEARFDEARFAEERLLGSADEAAQRQAYLPFSRRRVVAGSVAGPLQDSARAAGVPPVVALELVRAFSGVLDFEEDLLEGDRFVVGWRQEHTLAGDPIDVPSLLWAELRTAARGPVSVHRFRSSREDRARLWLASGEAAGPSVLRWPVDEYVVSSAFGLRPDPLRRVSPVRKSHKKGTGGPASRHRGRAPRFFMHQGIDLAAEAGTLIHAAAAGLVTGARPNGGYGNWVQIEHEGALATVYGHLSGFAPDLEEGEWVERGQVIGFVGSTGRSTGPHLHFEAVRDGVPADPVVHPLIERPRLHGLDLARFQGRVARDLEQAHRVIGEDEE